MNFIRAMRPLHWVKNLLVLAPLFFSGNLLNPHLLLRELAAFACFCLVSGHVYVVNDLVDVETDRQNAERKGRLFAAGVISCRQAIIYSILYAAMSLACGFLLSPLFALCLVVYALLTHSYTFALKKYRVAGIAIISAGMLIRILSGAVAIGVPVSIWVYPCAFILTFYVVAGKRIYDMAPENAAALLPVFKISGALTAVLYTVYTFSGVGPEKYHTNFLWLTSPFVAASCWRYYVITMKRRDDSNEHLHATLSDRLLISIVFVWAFVFAFLIYL